MNRLTAEQALPMLAESFREERPCETFDDLLAEWRAGANIWTGEKSAVFLRQEEFATGERVVHAGPAGGDLNEIMERGVDEVEAGAREIAATQVHVRMGRIGWIKPLQKRGYEITSVTMRKIL